MKSFQKFIILFVFTSSAFANSFTDPHDSTKSYPHPSFVLYSDEPYRSLKAVPSNTLITNTEFWVSLKAEASQQTLPQGETPPETDTSQLTNTVPTNETPLVAPSFSVGSTASVNFQENGSSTVYTALATGADSYAISGGSDALLFTINTATGILTFSSSPDYENPSDNGSDNNYSVKITATNSGGSSELSLTISVTDDTSDNVLPPRGSLDVRLGNISTAAYIPNDQPFSNGFQAQLDSASLSHKGAIMVGYTVVGSGNKNLLLTGKGHTEGDSNGDLIPPMSDPQMQVWKYPFNPSDQLSDPDGANDDWQNSSYQSSISKTNFFNQYESKYAGLYPTLSGGSYVSVISSVEGGAGNVRGETYETFQMGWDSSSNESTKLTGVSTNGWVQAGNEPGQRMTAGVGIRNLSPTSDSSLKKRLICMGKGLGHPYATPLYNPRIEVTDLNHNIIASNNSWLEQPSEMLSAINATGLMNNWGADNACVIVTVTPSELPYSSVLVKLYSEDGQSGNGLVEVYDLDLLESVYGYDVGE